jgi:hypothetical protein
MKREALGSTKMKKLCKLLNLKLYMAIGILEGIWHLTAREAPQGDIGKLSNEDIALAIDYEGDVNQLVETLVECRWLDVSDEYRLVVHDWHEHAEDSVKKRLVRTGRPFLSIHVRKCLDMSGQRRTSAENGSLPKPIPEPVPEPLPRPEPEPPEFIPEDSDSVISSIALIHPKCAHLHEWEIPPPVLDTIIKAIASEQPESGNWERAAHKVRDGTELIVSEAKRLGKAQFLKGPDQFWYLRHYRLTSAELFGVEVGNGKTSGYDNRTKAQRDQDATLDAVAGAKEIFRRMVDRTAGNSGCEQRRAANAGASGS